MTDGQLRELARRFAASGDPTDEARLLAERLRVSDVDLARLEIAAYVGHGPAIEVLRGAAPIGRHMPWRRWRAALDEASRAPLIAVGLGRLERQLAALGPVPEELVRLSSALRAWARCPCAEHTPATVQERGELDDFLQRMTGHEHFGDLCDALASLQRFRRVIAAARPGKDLGRVLLELREVRAGETDDAAADDERDAVVRWALGAAHALRPAPAADERTYLLARCARGSLTPEKLELAAHAGHPAAQALVPHAPPVAEPALWVLSLERWGGLLPLRLLARLMSDVPPAHREPGPEFEGFRDDISEFIACGACHTALGRWAQDPRGSLAGACQRLRTFSDRSPPDLVDEHRALVLEVVDACLAEQAPEPGLVRRVLEARTSAGCTRSIRAPVVAWALHDAD